MAVILNDIDHVLADAFWRDPMIGTSSWDDYHAASIDDQPIQFIVDLVNLFWFTGQFEIVAITARPEKWRRLTMQWLLRHVIKIDDLLMRPDESFRLSAEMKVKLAKD